MALCRCAVFICLLLIGIVFWTQSSTSMEEQMAVMPIAQNDQPLHEILDEFAENCCHSQTCFDQRNSVFTTKPDIFDDCSVCCSCTSLSDVHTGTSDTVVPSPPTETGRESTEFTSRWPRVSSFVNFSMSASVLTSIITPIIVIAIMMAVSKCRMCVRSTVDKKQHDNVFVSKSDKPLENIEDEIEELQPSSENAKRMGVQLKGLGLSTAGQKWLKKSSFFEAFNKPTIDHLFRFRQDHCFRQTCTVCPAAVSLASHFASGTYGKPGSTLELQKEGVRLTTFKDFPTSAPVSALRLAQAGFYYTGEGDVVKCFSCGETYQGWQLGDRPTLVHARISPSCALVRGSDTWNMPLPLPVSSPPNFNEATSIDSGYGSGSSGYGSRSSAEAQSAGSASSDVQMDSSHDAVTDSLSLSSSGPQAMGSSLLAPSSAPVSPPSGSVGAGPVPSSTNSAERSVFTGVSSLATDSAAPRLLRPMPTRRLDLSGAVYPLYSQMDARKRSFTSWPGDNGLPAVDELIPLGFFYAGYADCVRCFFCGIGLKSWEEGDIPAEVHARWRPTCEYLRLVKGDEFVDLVANGGRNIAAGGANQNRDSGSSGNGNSQSPASNNPASQGSSSNQQGAPAVPDLAVVRRARDTGYTDAQIAEAVSKLKDIGLESAIEVMLVEVLTNLFGESLPSSRQQTNNSTSSQAQNAGNPAPTNQSNLQVDGPRDDNVADNASPPSNMDERALQARHQALQQENARLRDMRTCQRCHNSQVGVIFLPCGHIVACTTCAPNIRRCLRCDSVIRATANVFFS